MTVRMPDPENVPPPGGPRWNIGFAPRRDWSWWPRVRLSWLRWKEVEAKATSGAYWLRYQGLLVAVSWGRWLWWVQRFVERRPGT